MVRKNSEEFRNFGDGREFFEIDMVRHHHQCEQSLGYLELNLDDSLVENDVGSKYATSPNSLRGYVSMAVKEPNTFYYVDKTYKRRPIKIF